MRAFIAIELPQDIKTRLSRVQDRLKKFTTDVKWVTPGNIHLTLKFINEIDQDKLKMVIKMTEEIARDRFQFNIAFSTLGVFPNPSYPRIIWAGINEGDKETRDIALELENKLGRLGISRENREFYSHVTLGRIKFSASKPAIIKNLKNLKDEFANEKFNFTADKITVFKSTLAPDAPVYEALKEITLKTT